jgi:hypothetical protein
LPTLPLVQSLESPKFLPSILLVRCRLVALFPYFTSIFIDVACHCTSALVLPCSHTSRILGENPYAAGHWKVPKSCWNTVSYCQARRVHIPLHPLSPCLMTTLAPALVGFIDPQFSAQSRSLSHSQFRPGPIPPLLLEAPKRAVKLHVQSDPSIKGEALMLMRKHADKAQLTIFGANVTLNGPAKAR